MAVFGETIEINAPPEAVWAFLSDANRYHEWVTVTDRMVEVPEEPMGVGTVYREYGGWPVKSESTWRVTEFDPPNRQVHEGRSWPIRFLLSLQLEVIEGGTRLNSRFDIHYVTIMWAMGMFLYAPFVRGKLRSIMRETTANIKRLVEAEQG